MLQGRGVGFPPESGNMEQDVGLSLVAHSVLSLYDEAAKEGDSEC